MSKKIIICITVLLFSGIMYAKGAFVEVGDPSFFPDDFISLISMKIDNNGNIYAAYIQDYEYFSVAKFDGESWSDVGKRKFSGGIGNMPSTPNVEPYVSFTLSSDGVPFVAFPEAQSYRLNVMEFDSESGKWEYVGKSNITDYKTNYTSIAVDSEGVPYVIFNGCKSDDCKRISVDQEEYTIDTSNVMKFNGTEWEYVGEPWNDFEPDSSEIYTKSNNVILDSNNNPVISFIYNYIGDLTSVMKYNGTKWEMVGDLDEVLGRDFFIDSKDNLYFDDAGAYAGLMKFDGSSWQRIADLESYDCSFAIDKNDMIYSSYIKVYNESSGDILKLNVQKFNGSEWEFLVSPDFKKDVFDQMISIDNNNIPWILLKNKTSKIELLKYDPEAVETPDDSDDIDISDEDTAVDEDETADEDKKDSDSSGCGMVI